MVEEQHCYVLTSLMKGESLTERTVQSLTHISPPFTLTHSSYIHVLRLIIEFKVDSELLAHLTRMDWLPTSYVPSRELRWLRSLLRHRAFRVKMSTMLKNRSRSEFMKRDIHLNANLGTRKGRDLAVSLGIFEVNQNMKLLEVIERQIYEIKRMLMRRYSGVKPVRLLMGIPGRGLGTV